MIVYKKIMWSSKDDGDNDCENCPRVKLVGDWKNTGPQGLFLHQQKNSDLKRDTPQKKIGEQIA